VDSSFEDQAKVIWGERRRRLAIKKLGGIKVSLLESNTANGDNVNWHWYKNLSIALGEKF
jgi:hypothetical protein